MAVKRKATYREYMQMLGELRSLGITPQELLMFSKVSKIGKEEAYFVSEWKPKMTDSEVAEVLDFLTEKQAEDPDFLLREYLNSRVYEKEVKNEKTE